MERITKLKELIATTETEAQKFYERGNSAAGTRLRRAMQEIKALAQDIRQDVMAKKKA